jgi:hypothetical protein
MNFSFVFTHRKIQGACTFLEECSNVFILFFLGLACMIAASFLSDNSFKVFLNVSQRFVVYYLSSAIPGLANCSHS